MASFGTGSKLSLIISLSLGQGKGVNVALFNPNVALTTPRMHLLRRFGCKD